MRHTHCFYSTANIQPTTHTNAQNTLTDWIEYTLLVLLLIIYDLLCGETKNSPGLFTANADKRITESESQKRTKKKYFFFATSTKERNKARVRMSVYCRSMHLMRSIRFFCSILNCSACVVHSIGGFFCSLCFVDWPSVCYQLPLLPFWDIRRICEIQITTMLPLWYSIEREERKMTFSNA